MPSRKERIAFLSLQVALTLMTIGLLWGVTFIVSWIATSW